MNIYKRIRYQPPSQNSQKTKEQRKVYGEFFLEDEELNNLYIDEVLYSLCQQRNRIIENTQYHCMHAHKQELNCPLSKKKLYF